MAGNLGTLPPEIIGEILDYLPPKKMHRLASISRKFNACCSRIAHRDIELHDFERVKRCCETLAFNHTAAGYVKRLSLSFADRSEVTSQFTRLLRSALQNTSNALRSLELHGAVSSCIKRLTFPHLNHFQIDSPFNPDVALFLVSHPNLERVKVLGPLNLAVKARGSGGAYQGMSIAMPRLKDFTGPPGACPILLLPSSEALQDVELTSSGIIWNANFIDSVPHTIKALGFKEFTYRQGLFDSVGRRLTSITKLTLGFSHPNQVEVVLDGLVSLLPKLEQLYHLRLTPPAVLRVDYDRMDESILDMDYAILSKITDHCETLAICDSFSTLTWGRLATSGQWLPLFPTPVGIHWWFQRTQLCTRLQRRMITHLANEEPIDSDEEDAMDEDDIFKQYQPNIHKLAKAVGFIVNRSFGLDAAPPLPRSPSPSTANSSSKHAGNSNAEGNGEGDRSTGGNGTPNVHSNASATANGNNDSIPHGIEEDIDTSPDVDEHAGEYEQLRVPIRDFDGRVLTPYNQPPSGPGSSTVGSSHTGVSGSSREDIRREARTMALWDTFASVLGFVTLHPVPIFLANVEMFDRALPVIRTPPPVLGEEQQELLRLIMDLVWNSFIDGKSGNGGGGKSGSGGKRRKQKKAGGQTNSAADAGIDDEESEEEKERRRQVVTDDDYERKDVKDERSGIKLKNYFRNPHGIWQEKSLSLGVATDSVVVPIGQFF